MSCDYEKIKNNDVSTYLSVKTYFPKRYVLGKTSKNYSNTNKTQIFVPSSQTFFVSVLPSSLKKGWPEFLGIRSFGVINIRYTVF